MIQIYLAVCNLVNINLYRVLGNARFTVGCLIRLANMRRYHGMISFLPAENHRLKEMNYVQQVKTVSIIFKLNV